MRNDLRDNVVAVDRTLWNSGGHGAAEISLPCAYWVRLTQKRSTAPGARAASVLFEAALNGHCRAPEVRPTGRPTRRSTRARRACELVMAAPTLRDELRDNVAVDTADRTGWKGGSPDAAGSVRPIARRTRLSRGRGLSTPKPKEGDAGAYQNRREETSCRCRALIWTG